MSNNKNNNTGDGFDILPTGSHVSKDMLHSAFDSLPERKSVPARNISDELGMRSPKHGKPSHGASPSKAPPRSGGGDTPAHGALRRVAVVFSVMLVAVTVIMTAYVGAEFIFPIAKTIITADSGTFGTGDTRKTEKMGDDSEYVDDNRVFAAMYDVEYADSLDELCKAWATNGGEKLCKKNVLNVLVCGVDSNDGTMDGARADSIMLLSVDKANKKITIVSFMRDIYTYILDADGQEHYRKINSAYHLGGPELLVKTIEDDYKIEIDHYICADFVSFPKLINAVGGVRVNLEEYEANFLNRTYNLDLDYGPNIKLKGEQALWYCRIRYSDSDGDVSRTRRQRTLITALINSAKSATLTQLNDTLGIVIQNVRTDMTRSEILSLGTQALARGWMNYSISQLLTPGDENCIDALIRTEFEWVVDLPKEAQIVQKALYGTTNIIISDTADRVCATDFIEVSYSEMMTEGGDPSDSGDSGNTEETTRRQTLFDVIFGNGGFGEGDTSNTDSSDVDSGDTLNTEDTEDAGNTADAEQTTQSED